MDLTLTMGDRRCDITMRRGAIDTLPAWINATFGAGTPTLIVTDTAVESFLHLHERPDMPDIIAVAPTEASKSPETLATLYDALQAAPIPRTGAVVAIGGGMVSDLGGFAAATWLRGIRWGAVPTTLLSMADATIGGKVGINWRGAKNQVGAFWLPSGILIDPALLQSLPGSAYLSGMGEMLKVSCLDRDAYDWLEGAWAGFLQRDPAIEEEAIARSIALKCAVVEADPTETGRRRQLNLGHTLGHALESAWGGEVPHGLCVAIGLEFVTRVGVALGRTDPALADSIVARVRTLAIQHPPYPSWEALLRWMVTDKKRVSDGTIRWQLVASAGEIIEESMAVDLLLLSDIWGTMMRQGTSP